MRITVWRDLHPRVDMFYSILLFYLLSILVIGLNGEPLPEYLNFDVFLILNCSSMGLSESLQ